MQSYSELHMGAMPWGDDSKIFVMIKIMSLQGGGKSMYLSTSVRYSKFQI